MDFHLKERYSKINYNPKETPPSFAYNFATNTRWADGVPDVDTKREILENLIDDLVKWYGFWNIGIIMHDTDLVTLQTVIQQSFMIKPSDIPSRCDNNRHLYIDNDECFLLL